MRSAKNEMRHQMWLALAVVALFGGTTTAWSFMAPLGSAIVSSGIVVAEGNLRKVQHQTGGVVGALYVTEGQHVTEGDLLVRLNDTDTKASLNIVINDLTSARAREARLLAERAGRDEIGFPADLLKQAEHDDAIDEVLSSERKFLVSRHSSQDGQRQQMDERIGQLNEQIDGLQQQLDAAKAGREVAAKERQSLQGLAAAHLVTRPRMTQLDREVVQAEGVIGSTIAKIAELKGKIKETVLQKSQLEKESLSDVSKDLRETETKIGEMEQRLTSAQEQLKRIEIRAPISGKVHQLAVHTVGGVVSPTEPMMLIVPESDRLIVEIKIAPQDIDQVHFGQDVRVRFTAFNKRTTPELTGTVSRIAGDLSREPQTGAAFYLAGVSISDDEMKRLDGLKLLPGMPAEAFIVTGERTFASYILKPITDQMQRAVREK